MSDIEGSQTGNTTLGWPAREGWLAGVHEWTWQDCGELETSPAVTLLGHRLTAPEVLK